MTGVPSLQGPKFTSPLKEPKDLDDLVQEGTNSRLQYVFDAITLTRHKLEGKVPLLGFTGAPVEFIVCLVRPGPGPK